ncbi:MAG TPA: hypothetical protein VGJ39_16545 [Vicinamibacterales bacterium]
MDTGSVLGLPQVRSPFLVDLLNPRRRQTEAGSRAARITDFPLSAMPPFDLDDDVDDDEDDDFDEDEEDSDGDEDEEDSGDEGDDVETWQVTPCLTPSLDLLD